MRPFHVPLLPSALRALVSCALRPWEGFPRRRVGAPPLGRSLLGMVLWRSPIAALATGLALVQYRNLQSTLLEGRLPLGGMAVDPTLLREFGRALPPIPLGLPLLLAILAAAPLGVLSLWLHHAVWDHASLWLLGCRHLPFRDTARAEADAVCVGTVGAAVALLGDVPGVGWMLTPLLLPLSLWFWGMRGFALAAWHGLPVWKGIVATLVHAVAALVFFLLLLGLSWLLALSLAGAG